MQDETSRGIGLDHVRVRAVVATEGKAARRGVGRLGGADLASGVLDVGGLSQTTIGQDRQDRDGPAEVIGDEQKSAVRMDADIGRACAAGADGVEQFQLAVLAIDREGAHRPFVAIADPICLIGRINAGSICIQREAARAGAHLLQPDRRQRPGGSIHIEQMDAPAVTGWQVHLRRQHVLQWRAEGPDIGDQPTFGVVGSRR